MTAPQLSLVCDSGPGIGSGHLVRQLSVAQEWIKAGGSVSLTTPGELPPWLLERYLQASVSFVDQPPSTTDIILYDSYRLDLDLVEHAATTALTVITDDFGQLPAHPCMLVLDHNVGATPDSYQDCSPSTRLLLGSPYTLVRPEFVSARADRLGWQRAEGPIRVLVALGGDPDPADFHSLQSSIRRHVPEAQQLVADGSVSDMARFMTQADFAISASGSTVYELCTLGIPSVVIPIVENQRQIADEMCKLGAIVVSDLDGAAIDLATLVTDQQHSATISAIAQSLIDGRGPRRVVMELRNMLDTGNEVPPPSD